jgi:hypothetical protein
MGYYTILIAAIGEDPTDKALVWALAELRSMRLRHHRVVQPDRGGPRHHVPGGSPPLQHACPTPRRRSDLSPGAGSGASTASQTRPFASAKRRRVDPGPPGAVRRRVRKFGSRGSREPARRGNAFRGRHRRCGGGSGVEVVGSHRRDIDVLRQAADLLDELAAAGKFGEVAGSTRACL